MLLLGETTLDGAGEFAVYPVIGHISVDCVAE